MRHTMRLPWSAIRDELGYKSVGAAQLAVKGHEQRTPPETAAGVRRSGDETLNYLLTGELDLFTAARVRGDDDAAVKHADTCLKLVTEQTKMHGAYLPQPTADQNVNVTVNASRVEAVESWRQQMLEHAPGRPELPVLDVEPESITEGDR